MNTGGEKRGEKRENTVDDQSCEYTVSSSDYGNGKWSDGRHNPAGRYFGPIPVRAPARFQSSLLDIQFLHGVRHAPS